MRLTSSLVLILAATALAAPAFAQDAGGVDLTAFKAQRSQAMMRLDTDHDGKISQAEFAARKQAANGGGHGDKLFAMADRNHDGYLSADEVGAILERRFAKLDANHDGKVDASERQAAHHGRGQQPTGF